MKKRHGSIIAVIAVLGLGLAATPTWAGSKQQHRWEGVAIGVGAVIAGSALINHNATGYHGRPPVTFSFNYRQPHRYPPKYRGSLKRHHGGHHNRWRSHDRGLHWRGPSRHGNTHGTGHRMSWQPHGRKASAGHGRHSGGHGGPRR